LAVETVAQSDLSTVVAMAGLMVVETVVQSDLSTVVAMVDPSVVSKVAQLVVQLAVLTAEQ